MIPIENETKRVIDWNPIRAEYIGGGISQRKLAKKYNLSETTLMKKANAEGWHQLRKRITEVNLKRITEVNYCSQCEAEESLYNLKISKNASEGF